MFFALGHFATQLVEEVFEETRFVLLLGRFGLQRDPVKGPAFSASTPFMAGFDAADLIPHASVPIASSRSTLLLDQR
jgi:hypothetical protein